MAQPDLDYIAPELQLDPVGGAVAVSGDIYSLGLLACSLHNNGRSLVQAGHSTQNYTKAIEQLPELYAELCHRLPERLVEPIRKMISRDVQSRPTAELFALLPYFDDSVVHCMQNLDTIESKQLSQKKHFFNRLSANIAFIPARLLYKSVLPIITEELRHSEIFPFVLPSFISLVKRSSVDDYRLHVQRFVKILFAVPKPLQGTLYLVENLDPFLAKAEEDDVQADILPLLFGLLEANSVRAQEASIAAFGTIQGHMDEDAVRRLVLPRTKELFHRTTAVRVRLNALSCIERLIDGLDKMTIIEEVVPFLTEIQSNDVDVIMAVVGLYHRLLGNRKYGLTHNLLATKILPCLIPHTVIPTLSLDQFSILMDVLRSMLNQVDQQRRSKMITELPDDNALELRSNLQQMYVGCLSSGGRNSQSILLAEDLLAIARTCEMGKRLSQTSSNSSSGSSYSAGRVTPRTSIDLKYNTSFESPKSLETTSLLDSKCFLSVEEAYQRRYNRRSCRHYSTKQIPSAPELQTKGSSRESLEHRPYKRHSSFQGLGMEEQAALEKIVRERRCSLIPEPPRTPHILVSDSSSNCRGPFFQDPPRRSSSRSIWSTLAPVSSSSSSSPR